MMHDPEKKESERDAENIGRWEKTGFGTPFSPSSPENEAEGRGGCMYVDECKYFLGFCCRHFGKVNDHVCMSFLSD